MNRLSVSERAQILACLCEGNSLRSTARLTGAAINTVVKLLIDAGHACANYHDKTVRGIVAKRIQAVAKPGSEWRCTGALQLSPQGLGLLLKLGDLLA